jgi:hypothetical protein
MVRLVQPVSVCRLGLVSYAEQPEPVPSVLLVFQTVSVQPRVVEVALVSAVPPTEVTYCEAAGYSAP